jgi:hypothetical protein
MAVAQSRPMGRRTKKTEQTVKALMKAIATGAPYVICCRAVGIHFDTFMHWKSSDAKFASLVEQTAAKAALRLLGKIEEQATNNFSACAWILERRFPELFSRPEVQLNLQTNFTQNNLSITISAAEAREIEEVAEPTRVKVREMFSRYKPGLGGGNGESVARVSSSGEKVVEPPIERKEGEENSAAFWLQFASGASDQIVEKGTAIYVAKTIVDEALGAGRGNQAIVEFKNEPVMISDILATIDRLCGGNPAGWQRLQRRAGF